MPLRPALAALLSALALAPSASAEYPESPEDTLREPGRATAFIEPPSDGRISSPFGYRGGGMHTGIDFEGWRYTTVRAPLPGRVSYVGWLDDYSGLGKVLKIRHAGGLETLYAHLAYATVRRGDWVQAGDVIAEAGCTGSCTGTHLHFEVRIGGRLVDPLPFLASTSGEDVTAQGG